MSSSSDEDFFNSDSDSSDQDSDGDFVDGEYVSPFMYDSGNDISDDSLNGIFSDDTSDDEIHSSWWQNSSSDSDSSFSSVSSSSSSDDDFSDSSTSSALSDSDKQLPQTKYSVFRALDSTVVLNIDCMWTIFSFLSLPDCRTTLTNIKGGIVSAKRNWQGDAVTLRDRLFIYKCMLCVIVNYFTPPSSRDVRSDVFLDCLIWGHNYPESAPNETPIAEAFMATRDSCVTKASKNRSTPLLIASSKGKLEMVKNLVEVYFVKVNARNKFGETALHYACENNHFEVVQYLLEKGARANIVTSTGMTPLMCACACGNVDIVTALMTSAYPVLINNQDHHGGRPAIGLQRNYRKVSPSRRFWDTTKQTFFLKKIPRNQGSTALMRAVEFNHKTVAEYLLNTGECELDIIHGYHKETVVMRCAACNCYSIMPLLMTAGCDMNMQDRRGETAIMKAIRAQLWALSVSMMEMGADSIQIDGLADDDGHDAWDLAHTMRAKYDEEIADTIFFAGVVAPAEVLAKFDRLFARNGNSENGMNESNDSGSSNDSLGHNDSSSSNNDSSESDIVDSSNDSDISLEFSNLMLGNNDDGGNNDDDGDDSGSGDDDNSWL